MRWLLALGILGACRDWHAPVGELVDDGPGVVIASAPDGYLGRHASVVRHRGTTWVAWETTLPGGFDSTLTLLHSAGDPLVARWSSTEVVHTDGPTRPSLEPGPEGLWMLYNHCDEPCVDRDLSQARLDHLPVTEPLVRDGRWELPVGRDAGRGDVGLLLDPDTEIPVDDDVVACFSDNLEEVESLRCDVLGPDGAWRNDFVLESGLNADHPSVIVDAADRLLVGFSGRVNGRREAQLRFVDGDVLRFAPGLLSGEVHLARAERVLHATWTSRKEGLWRLHYGTCSTYPACKDLADWRVEELTRNLELDGMGLVSHAGGVAIVWTEGPSEEELSVRLAWMCDGEPQFETVASDARSNQGQPSMALRGDGLVLAYVQNATEEHPDQLRLQRMDRVCP